MGVSIQEFSGCAQCFKWLYSQTPPFKLYKGVCRKQLKCEIILPINTTKQPTLSHITTNVSIQFINSLK